uniref:Late nodulin domain-containing protein n=1 Tax=Medicago truncatula TaxID=3880 RepID=I3SRZ7_MEDTR|nr:unknown [Medicago truncatula]
MAKFVQFVYFMIIFLYVFLVSINIDAFAKCIEDSDCPPSMYCEPSFFYGGSGLNLILNQFVLNGECRCYIILSISIPTSLCI